MTSLNSKNMMCGHGFSLILYIKAWLTERKVPNPSTNLNQDQEKVESAALETIQGTHNYADINT